MTSFSLFRAAGIATSSLFLLLVGCSRASEEELDVMLRIDTSPYPPGVGASCIPSDEIHVDFGGFSPDEVKLETAGGKNARRCGIATHCLVDHFQGRVSCPYGQTAETALACTDPDACRPGSELFDVSCRVPDADTARMDSRIVVPVSPQLRARRAKDHVYCTCDCGGGDPNCVCPNGFSCGELGSSGRSICLKNGEPGEDASICEFGVSDENGGCGGDGKNP